MSNLEQLRAEHAELIRLVGALSEAIVGEAPPPAAPFGALRDALSTTLIRHLKIEDWVLYPRLLDSDDPVVATTARTFNDQMGGLAAEYIEYVQKWSALAIECDWRGFCADSAVIVQALTQRIVRENRELYPLLERQDKAA